MTFRYLSRGPFTGVHDKNLDRLINQATSTIVEGKRASAYKSIFGLIAERAHSPFVYVSPGFNIASKNVFGPGNSLDGPQVTGRASE